MLEIDLYILLFLLLFLILFILDYFLILRPKLIKILKGKVKKKIKFMEMDYLSIKFNLNKKKLYKRWIILWIALINSFIISVVSFVVIITPLDYVYQFMIGFLLLLGLIYALYDFFGRYLIKKGLN